MPSLASDVVERTAAWPRLGWTPGATLARTTPTMPDGATAWRQTALLLAAAAVTAVPYGAAMGWWHGGHLAAYAGIKLPLLLILTWALTFPCGWMLNRVTGLSVPLREVAPASVHPLLGAGVALLALVPVNLLFTLSFPQPDPGQPANHNALYLIHVLTVSSCGMLATGPLRRLLCESGRAGTAVFAGWVGVYTLVAGEVAWALRPFIGNPYQPVRFLRHDALDGNVYEFIWTDILPRFVSFL